MDDRTFDQKTAMEWIQMIEVGKSLREEDIYPKLRTWINLVSPSEILDIGAGQGICSDKIDLHGRSYTGVEPSSYLLDRAKQQYPQANRRFLLASAYELPLPDGVIDAAFSITVWHLLSDLQKAASELSRVLKTGGEFLIITANPASYPAWMDFYTDKKLDGRRFEGAMQAGEKLLERDVLYFHTFDEIIDSLQTVHLKVQKTETFRASPTAGVDMLISIHGNL